jgi:DNA-binding transcriptional ArsR family regulator
MIVTSVRLTGMHLIPAGSHNRRVIDSDRACDAIAALGDPATVLDWSARYSLLSDPTRLSLLLCIRHVAPISVSDLGIATGLADTTVSQALRLLRSCGAVTANRQGRVVRYTLADATLIPLLDVINPNPALPHAEGTATA